jgi:crotonobetainyl-CoA:carnitine CoA-transferase CaiB-like acyl-CoA transferase
VLDDEVLRTEPRFATNLERLQNHGEMKARIEAALGNGTTAEWVGRFEAAAIAAGPIYELDEVFGDPQVRHLGLLAEVAQPTYEAHGGNARMLGFPFRASGTPASIRRPAPLLGEHTAEVLTEVLGLSTAEITQLAGARTITLAP